MKCYCVGGAVRDRLLGRPVTEKDYVVVGASPALLIEKGFKPVGKDFPVFLHPTTHEEYALARTERKKGKGYTGFEVYAAPHITLVEDLKRRDLTINAIAEDEQGKLIDPYGGYQDLQNRVLRHVSEAFVEDPVRILRIARFMACLGPLGFKIAPETLALMKVMVKNREVDALVPERVWREFEKALAGPEPERFIESLIQCYAWYHICPEWQSVSNTCQALHTLKKSSEYSQDLAVRFASVMKFVASDAHQVESAQQLLKRWRVPAVYRDLLLLVIRCSHALHQVREYDANQLLSFIERLDALRRQQRFQQFLWVCEADWQARFEKPTTYTQRYYILSAVQTIQSIDLTPLKNANLQGLAFSQALKTLRLNALSAFCASQ